MKFFEPATGRRKKPQGLIAIVALIMVGLMAIILIDLQMTVMDTIEGIKSRKNHFEARIKADSIMELLQFKAKNYDVGWNSGEIICGYGKFADQATTDEGGGQNEICQDPQVLWLVSPDPGKAQQDIRITIKTKGRNEDSEKIKTWKCGNSSIGKDECYVVPFPGSGDAGDEQYCKAYYPDFVGEPNAKTTVEPNVANGLDNIDQLNYSCNWGRLRFGSAITDRVSIPLYYDEAKLGEDSGIVNVFKETTNFDFKADNILVRVRTPCVPCGDKMNNGAIRECDAKEQNDTVCTDNERYVLDDGGKMESKKNDIVVQWLINGECSEGGNKLGFCGVIPIGDKTKKEEEISAFYESKINEVNNGIYKYILIDNKTITYDTSTYPKTASLLETDDEENYPIKLPLMSKPVLTMFLSHPLLTSDKWRIPYLEYQVLTDKPVSSNESVLEVNVVVDTNGYTRTITKEVPKPLIDFAIQMN